MSKSKPNKARQEPILNTEIKPLDAIRNLAPLIQRNGVKLHVESIAVLAHAAGLPRECMTPFDTANTSQLWREVWPETTDTE